MGIELLWLMGGVLVGSAGTVCGTRIWRKPLSEVPPKPLNSELPSRPSTPVRSKPEPSNTESLTPDRLAYYQALELAQFKGGFLARTAHELRSPLSSLMGLHQLILTDLCDSPEEERECVAQAYEAAQNFFGLLESIIEVSKFDTGARTLKPQSFPLSGLLEDVAVAVALPMGDRNVRLTIGEVFSDTWVQADYDYLRQVLVQLLLTMVELKASNVLLEVVHDSADSNLPESLKLKLSTDERDATLWQESLSRWQVLQQQQLPSPTSELIRQWRPQRLSAGFSLFLQQCLLEMMGGRLEAGTDGALLCWVVRSEAEV